jgi:hypothetical protein
MIFSDNCGEDRGLDEAARQCAVLITSLGPPNDYAKYCNSCGGESKGYPVWLIGKPYLGGVTQSDQASTARDRVSQKSQKGATPGAATPKRPGQWDFSARYGCCIDSGPLPRNRGSPEGPGNRGNPSTSRCECSQTTTTPLTGAPIPCKCFFYS